MKTIFQIGAVLSFLLVTPASAQSLLGLDLNGLLGGSGSGVVSGNTSGGNTTIGVMGGSGTTLPTGGTGGSNSVGLQGILEVAAAPTQGGGTGAGISILGGTPQSNSLNPAGLLGNGGGIGLGLPSTSNLTGGGGNGGNGGNSGNSTVNLFASLGPAGNGGNGANGGNGGNGIGITGASTRLQAILRVLAARNYLRLANGKAVCLSSFNTAEVASMVPQRDWGSLQQALGSYSQDIYALRQMLANCRNASQRQALNLTDLNRVIAIDVRDGQPVLYML